MTDDVGAAAVPDGPDVADVVDLLADLVAVDSVNPSLAPDGAGEAAIAGVVVDWARTAGLHPEVVDAASGRPSVLVWSSPPDRDVAGPTLLLCGHLDTVGPGAMARPLDPRVEGDRLYGRGAYDMKAGLAACLVACREVARLGLPGRVVVAAVADEEHASRGVRAVLEHLDGTGTDAGVDAAIVAEPTERAVGVAHKGFVWQRVEVTGRAAHGSRPHLGTDAVVALGPLLVGLRELDRRLADAPHPLLGPGSVHASRISGGHEWSTIPGAAVLDVERRTIPGEDVATVEADLADLVGRVADAEPDARVTSRTVLVRDPMEVGRASAVARAVATAATSVEEVAPDVVGLSYWADAALLSAAGIPTVLYGPDGDGAHADVEWVSLSGTRRVADTLARVTTHLATENTTESA